MPNAQAATARPTRGSPPGCGLAGLKARHSPAWGEAPGSKSRREPSPEGARQSLRSTRAFSQLEVLLIVAALSVLTLLLVPALLKAKAKQERIRCSSHLKQVGLAHKVFATDHTNLVTGLEEFPARTSTNSGGSLEYVGTGNVGRHYQAMSNELGSAVVLVCPADKSRFVRRDFVIPMTNGNVSYSVGVDGSERTPNVIVASDWNMLSTFPKRFGILELTSSNVVSWGPQLHRIVGNVALSDGSVQQCTSNGLWQLALQSFRELETNRLEFP